MFGRKHIVITILFLLFTFLFSIKAYAVDEPSFPSCTSPQGEVKSRFDSGTHGIPGSSLEYKGSDTVYRISSDTVLQCFCSENGNGIQTNWWKISSLDQSQINTLNNLGWIYVANGALWGLQDGPYLSKSSEYSCGSGGSGGSVLGTATGKVLAATGDIVVLYSLIGVAILSLLAGFSLLKKK